MIKFKQSMYLLLTCSIIILFMVHSQENHIHEINTSSNISYYVINSNNETNTEQTDIKAYIKSNNNEVDSILLHTLTEFTDEFLDPNNSLSSIENPVIRNKELGTNGLRLDLNAIPKWMANQTNNKGLTNNLINDEETSTDSMSLIETSVDSDMLNEIYSGHTRIARDVHDLKLVLPNLKKLKEKKKPPTNSTKDHPNYPWGKHAFGPLEDYKNPPLGKQYNAYFFEQVIAVVLEDSRRNLINCTLLEIIPQAELREALRRLGGVMGLVPLNLEQSVVLNRFCFSPEELSMPVINRNKQSNKTESIFSGASSVLFGILPGTLWCGLGDRAPVYHRLGSRHELDSCCREHDHCPLKVKAGTTRYGVKNDGFATISHCMCEQMLLDCFRKVSQYDKLAGKMGKFYFNILPSNCLSHPDEEDLYKQPGPASLRIISVLEPESRADPAPSHYQPRTECVREARDGSCRLWTANPKALPLKLKIVESGFSFTPRRTRKTFWEGLFKKKK